MRRAWISSLLAVVTVLVPTADGAEAQRRSQPQQAAEEGQQPTAEPREQARQAYAAGQEAFRRGDFAAAVASFRAAYAAAPEPVVLVALAAALERQGDIPAAVEALERYLRERPDAADRAQVEARLERFRAMPATLVVTSTPPGAAIAIDGEPTDRVTPAEIEVPAGEHVVSVTLAEHEPASETVEATLAGRHEVELSLEPTVEPGLNEDPFGEAGEGGAPPSEPADIEPADEGKLSAGVWVAAGVSGAALVGGTVLGFLALSEQSDYDMMPTEDSADRGERLALFADVAFGVAAVAGITAIVLYVTGDSGGHPEDDDREVASFEVAPLLAPDGAGVTTEVRF